MSIKVKYYRPVVYNSYAPIFFPYAGGAMLISLSIIGFISTLMSLEDMPGLIPLLSFVCVVGGILLYMIAWRLLRKKRAELDGMNTASATSVGVTAEQAGLLLSHAAQQHSRSLNGVINAGGVFVVSEETGEHDSVYFHLLSEGDGAKGSNYGSLEVLA